MGRNCVAEWLLRLRDWHESEVCRGWIDGGWTIPGTGDATWGHCDKHDLCIANIFHSL